MSNVFVVLPTANVELAEENLRIWRDHGYKIALLMNGPAYGRHVDAEFITHSERYPGWGESINRLARSVFDGYPSVDWIVGAGDDMWPDPDVCPDKIASECTEHFMGTFGVMQPCGDTWLGNSDKICGSPWIGREFARRWNGGHGPFWPSYLHLWADTELHQTTHMLGRLWNRYDLTHEHRHFLRVGCQRPRPQYMERIYLNANADRALYMRRVREGFPGHEPAA